MQSLSSRRSKIMSEDRATTTITPIIAAGRAVSSSRKPQLPQSLRAHVWLAAFNDKTTGKCPCGQQITCFTFECGHIVAACQGGSDNPSNLRPICALCNKSMGMRNMNVFFAHHFPKRTLSTRVIVYCLNVLSRFFLNICCSLLLALLAFVACSACGTDLTLRRGVCSIGGTTPVT